MKKPASPATKLNPAILAKHKSLSAAHEAAGEKLWAYEKEQREALRKTHPITAGSILVRQRPEYTDTYYRVEEVCPTFHGNGEIQYRISRCNKRGERTGVSPSYNRVSAGNDKYKVFKLAPRTKD